MTSSSLLTDHRASVRDLIRRSDGNDSLYVRLPRSPPVRVVGSKNSSYFRSRPMGNAAGRSFCVNILTAMCSSAKNKEKEIMVLTGPGGDDE